MLYSIKNKYNDAVEEKKFLLMEKISFEDITKNQEKKYNLLEESYKNRINFINKENRELIDKFRHYKEENSQINDINVAVNRNLESRVNVVSQEKINKIDT
jgi:hypothetical protein